tara:strand:- start:119 stop:616 length:498 start_codon:yes stop_codon:yes gene_type:complete
MAGCFLMAACHSSSRPLQTVSEVNISKYEGTWYDIAHLTQTFQEGCSCVSANYSQAEDYIKVVNTCLRDGKMDSISGKAFPVEGSNNSKLKVQFFWPFKGDYQILALDEDYSTALVGAPDRESLWLLSRTTTPGATTIKEFLNRAEELGFDTSKMVYTDHSCNNK